MENKFMKRGRQLIATVAVAGLLLALLATSGCSSTTTFNYIGKGFQQGALAFKSQINILKLAGKTDPAKIVRLEKAADTLVLVATDVKVYIDDLAGVTGANKAEVLAKIADGLDKVNGILQNKDVADLGANSLAVQVLTYVSIGLRAGSAAIDKVKVPAGSASFGLGAANPGVPTNKIVVKVPAPPKGIERFFKP